MSQTRRAKPANAVQYLAPGEQSFTHRRISARLRKLSSSGAIVVRLLHLFPVAGKCRARMTEAVDRLIDIAHAEKHIFPADQIHQTLLLLVDVLIFVQHDLAETLPHTVADRGVVAQQANCVALQIGKIQPRDRRLALRVDFDEAFEDIEDQGPVRLNCAH